jgi:outer membrane protein assembly factor BamB
MSLEACSRAPEFFDGVTHPIVDHTEQRMNRFSLQRRLVQQLFLCGVCACAAHAADWTSWRVRVETAEWPGLTRRSLAEDARGAVEGPRGRRSRLAAHRKGRAYVFSRQEDLDVVRAFRLSSGKELWKATYAAPYKVNPEAMLHGAGPKATPTVDEGRLFTFGISGILSCFDAEEGKLIWQKKLLEGVSATAPLYGRPPRRS